MHTRFLVNLFEEFASEIAIIWGHEEHTYGSLIEKIKECKYFLNSNEIPSGAVVAIIGDFSPNSIALLFALIEKNCIIVPLTKKSRNNHIRFFSIAEVEFIIHVDLEDIISSETTSKNSNNDYYNSIRKKDHPGLVLFTSGTSGKPKAAVHDLIALLEKFKTRRKALRTLNFLLFDHWGGLNTMFHILSNGGVVIATTDRNPEKVCQLIEEHRVELLPSSPTFLNLLLFSNSYKNYDMSSLKIISYGTEPMPEATLIKLKNVFSDVKLIQTYGLIELGVLRSKSEKDDSLWVKVGGEGFKTRVKDGMLEIKAESAMLGYLNAPNPITADGWFKTGDMVLEKGDYIKILGRESEIINVGGEKVYPQEVENVIKELAFIKDVTVFGENNPIMGQIVCASINIQGQIEHKEIRTKIKKYCTEKLSKFKVPIKISIDENSHVGYRFKKIRSEFQ